MNLKQARDQGIVKVTRAPWNRFAYIEIVTPPDGSLTPWVRLWDIGTPGRYVLAVEVRDNDFIAWAPPDDWREEVYHQQTRP